MHHRRIAAAAGVTAIALSGVAVAEAKAPAALKLTLTKTRITQSGTRHAGATTLTYDYTGKTGAASPAVVHLGAGAKPSAFVAGVHKLGPQDGPEQLLAQTHSKLVTGSLEVDPGAPTTTTTVLAPGRYVVLNTAASKPKDWTSTSFSIPKGSGPGLPSAGGTVKLTDDMKHYRILAPKTLPAKGRWNVVNSGTQLHFLVGVSVPKKMSNAAALKDISSGNEKPFAKSAQASFMGLVSPGTRNQIAVSEPKGRWLLACFYGNAASQGMPHAMLGMERIVTLK